MGIPGIYKQIGPGERVALSKLACEHIEKTGKLFRLAIDISIWSFQIQSGQGGRNPALRTLYYRLLRLLALSIQPLFVFDGPHKPTFKRGKKIAPGVACLPDFLTKELLKRFGFPYHTAPGEAEAECALLQREGIVNAVLSEDVDTLMFGCGLSLRNWTAEGERGNKSPTHVNVYNAETTKATAGLDAHGMILVALMSGGDYVPAGIPGCGPKTACEAAKAGFGQDLCKLERGDVNGFREWRERLQIELQTNKSKLFRQKHKALTIPESFPDSTVLGYYVRPAVSSAERVNKLRKDIVWGAPVNVQDLRLFVAEAFNWPCLMGAKKFIRGLAPALLAHQLIQRNMSGIGDEQSLEAKESLESQVVKAICGRRSHWNTDGTPELKIAYIPNGIVGIDLNAEEDEGIEGYGNEEPEDEQPVCGGEDAGDRSISPTKKRGPSLYDPTEVEKIWVLETYVKMGVPLLVETWEEDMRNPKKFASRKAREKKVLSKPKVVTESGAIEQFVKISKPGVVKPSAGKAFSRQQDTPLPPVFLVPATASILRSPRKLASSKDASSTTPTSKRSVTEKTQPGNIKAKANSSTSQKPPVPPKPNTRNPWTLSKRPSDTLKFRSPTRYSALGIYAPDDPEYDDASQHRSTTGSPEPPTLVSPPPSPTPRKRRSRPTTPISDIEPPTRPPQSSPTNSPGTPHKPTGLATPSTRDPAKPSPRKKRSPLEMANELYLAGALKTPTSTRKGAEIFDVHLGEEAGEQLKARKVNRRLDFSATREERVGVGAVSPASEMGSLTLPETLLSPTAKKKGRVVPGVGAKDAVDPSPSSSPSSSSSFSKGRIEPNKLEKNRRFVALRESLEGAWKVLEPWDVDGGRVGRRRGVFAAVEVVDLTSC